MNQKQIDIFVANLMVAITLECFENENMMLEGLLKQKAKQDVKTMINIARRLLAPVRQEHEQVLTEISDSLQDVLNEIRAKLKEMILKQFNIQINGIIHGIGGESELQEG